MRRLFRALLCALPLLAAACGDSTGPGDPDLTTVQFAPALGVDIATMTLQNGVYYKDLTVGTGDSVSVGRMLRVRYSGFLSDGTEFQNNLTAASPYSFVLGARTVIQGWDRGIPGMKIGGERLLVIPPSLGYGDRPNGPIPANSVLVFRVKVEGQS